MNRLEFLKILWHKFFRPGLIAITLIIAIGFLYRTIAVNGVERETVVLLTGIVIFLSAFLLITLLMLFLTDWLHSKLPESLKRFLTVTFKLLGYLSPFIVGALLYYMWDQKNYLGMIFPAFYIFIDLKKMVSGVDNPSGKKTE